MTKRITDLETRLDRAFKREDALAKIRHQRDIYRDAIKAIINCNVEDCVEYVRVVDGIAVEADAIAEGL